MSVANGVVPDLSATRAYQEKLRGLLGGREPRSVLAQTPGAIGDLVSRHSHAQMRARPYAGKWTPSEIVGHLTDAEYIFGYRIRMILSEDRPTITSMDQDLWVTGQRHNEREPAELVEQFSQLRTWNLALWRRITPNELLRVGVHAQRGEESLGLLLDMHAGHDLSHIDQLTRYLQANRDVR